MVARRCSSLRAMWRRHRRSIWTCLSVRGRETVMSKRPIYHKRAIASREIAMAVISWRCLSIALLLVTLLGSCDGRDPLDPSFSAAKGSTVAAPTNLTLTVDSYHQIWFAWQDNATNESGYEVWKSTTGSTGTFSQFTTYPWPNTNAGGNDGLEPSTQYCYKVRAYSTQGQNGKIGTYSNFSNIACATTLSRIPPAPSNAHAAPNTWSTIEVTWTANAVA